MASITLNAWLRRAAAPAVAVAALLTTGVALAADKPFIGLVFEIESPTFKRTLPDAGASERNLAQRLAAELAPHHPFADWRPGVSTGGMGALIARLVEGNESPFPKIEVVWSLKLPSGERVLQTPLPNAVIYAPSNPNWDTSNGPRFETRVFEEMMKVVRSGGFHEIAFKEVLRKLPIATEVQPVERDRVVLVPLKWSQLRLGQGSELAVEFVRSNGTDRKKGRVALSRIDERGRDPGRGFVQGGVKEAVFDSQVLALDGGHWNAALQGLLTNATTVNCFITVFESAEFGGAAPGQPLLDPN